MDASRFPSRERMLAAESVCQRTFGSSLSSPARVIIFAPARRKASFSASSVKNCTPMKASDWPAESQSRLSVGHAARPFSRRRRTWRASAAVGDPTGW